MTIQEKLKQANKIIEETELVFKLQREYFDHGRTYDALRKSIAQEKKVKALIKEYKKPNTLL